MSERATPLLPLPPARVDPAAEPVVVEGVVARVVYSSPDGEFAVVRLDVAGRDFPLAVIGALSHVGEGETVRVTGQWEVHPQYGQRLRAQTALPLLPETALGVERYLATLSGLGPETARRLVSEFGVRAIEVLESEPWRVAQLKGIGKRRCKRAALDARARREEREVMIFLQAQGISAAYAARIRKVYGESAMAKVRENPYRLAKDVPGIGFQVADRIAQGMGVDSRSPLRVEEGLRFVLLRASDEGHCFLPLSELRSRASAELRLTDPAPSLTAGADPPPLSDKTPSHDRPLPLDRPLTPETARPPDRPARLDDPPTPETAPALAPALDTEALLDAALLGLRGQQGLIVDGQDAYLPWLHRAELGLAQRLIDLRDAHRGAVPQVPVERAQPPLAEGQRRALRLIEGSPLCVITGGPGTGKTTIIRNLVRTWEGAARRVLLCAPTGRAAKRLAEATGTTACTVHRLLEWTPAEGFRRRSEHTLETDLLVCDEASMLDLPLCRALCQAVPIGATLVLVGDVDQLPSVGPGRVLADVIASGQISVARLREIFRQAEGSGIVENAHRVLAGELPVSAPRGEALGDFYFIEADDPAHAQELIVRLLTERIPQRFRLDPVRDVQVLTPMHRGEVGTTELNRVLQAALNPPGGADEVKNRGRVFRRGDKVMQVKNDYERDVWNGDVGVVAALDAEEGELLVRFDDDREVQYEGSDIDQLELAYAVSVHKSQGSEYPAVVVPLVMQHYVLLRRNLLYTAMTRGKRLVVIVGSKRALWRAVNEQGDLLRYTRLGDRLSAILRP